MLELFVVVQQRKDLLSQLGVPLKKFVQLETQIIANAAGKKPLKNGYRLVFLQVLHLVF